MLEEYKNVFLSNADLIPNWKELTKNELCRQYVANSNNLEVQNSYFSAIMYRYWNLISKYYYMSSNVASPEDCYEWLEDSVLCCLKENKWNDKTSSIYNDPDGPDKVINRCMKCARLTYYQYINRKKRRDNFGLLSLDELSELFGNTVSEPEDDEVTNKDVSVWEIKNYINTLFTKKDYFTAILLDFISEYNVFDVTIGSDHTPVIQFNPKKLTKLILNIDESYIKYFSNKYNIDIDVVRKGISYVSALKPPVVAAKIPNTLDNLKHQTFFQTLRGD